MVFRLIFILCLSLISHNSYSTFIDSVKYYLKNYKPQYNGGLSSRNTFIGDTKNKVAGISAGAEYGNKIGFSAGIYWLSVPINKIAIYNSFQPDEYKQREISNFWYFGLQSYYKFYKVDKWTLNIPLRIGIGAANTRNYDISPQNKFLSKSNTAIFPIESGLNFLYSATWWIGVSGGLGSRIVLGNNTSTRFSGTYYTFGTVFFFSNIYKKLPEEFRKKIEDYKDNIIK